MYHQLKKSFGELVVKAGLAESKISVTARKLSIEEAIGKTERKDFPLLQGKESLMQAEFMGAVGQAFTDMPANFRGQIKDILNLEMNRNSDRALFIATLNAVMRHLGKADRTIHCKNSEPEMCSMKIAQTITEKFGIEKTIGVVGFQPAIIDNCAKIVTPKNVRVVDLDKDNIGKTIYGVLIQDGFTTTEKLFEECDVVLATGSTIVNDTLKTLLALAEKHGKPLYLFGTTIAGAAEILKLKRLCFYGA
ncbi:MAG: hypothetical protein JXX14_09430 [Deltaproteobacteria bacterium]|nr:hypothetical protein [Deltaproteobacteria bacterium]